MVLLTKIKWNKKKYLLIQTVNNPLLFQIHWTQKWTCSFCGFFVFKRWQLYLELVQATIETGRNGIYLLLIMDFVAIFSWYINLETIWLFNSLVSHEEVRLHFHQSIPKWNLAKSLLNRQLSQKLPKNLPRQGWSSSYAFQPMSSHHESSVAEVMYQNDFIMKIFY